ncbi:MAG: MBL fold metallo-hydrolase [Candidatus Caldatribacteriaceae bacterium]
MVIISHLHWDHAGSLYLFSGTRAGNGVIVGEEDLKMAFFSVYLTPQRFSNGYFKEDIDVPDIVYWPVRGNCEIAEGIEVMSLGGHTPQVLGLVVHLEHFGTVVLTSDAFPMRENLGPPSRLPGIMDDSRAFYDAVEKVERLCQKFQAMVIHPHDPEQFSTLRHSPEYYE